MADKRKKAKAVELIASDDSLPSKGRKRQAKDEINIDVSEKGKKKAKVVLERLQDMPSNDPTKDSEETKIELVEKKGKKKAKVVQDNDDKIEDVPSNGLAKDSDEADVEVVEKKGKKKAKVVQDSIDKIDVPSNGATQDSEEINIEVVEKKGKKKAKVVQDNNDKIEDVQSKGATQDSDGINIEVVEKKSKKKVKVVQDNNDKIEDVQSNGATQDSDGINIEVVEKKGKKKAKVVQDNNEKIEDVPKDVGAKKGRKKKANSEESQEEMINGHKDDVIENGADKKKGRKRNMPSENNDDEPSEGVSSKSSKGSTKKKADTKVSEDKIKTSEPEKVLPAKGRKLRPKAAVDIEAPAKEEKKGKKKAKPAPDTEKPEDEIVELSSVRSKESSKDKGDVKESGQEKKGRNKTKAKNDDELPSNSKSKPVQENDDEPEEELPTKRRKGAAKDKGDVKESVPEKKGRNKTKVTNDNELPSISKGRKKPTKDKGDAAENSVEEPVEIKETTVESAEEIEEATNEEPPTKTRKLPAKKTASNTKKEPLKNKAATDFTQLDFLNSSQTADGKEWNLKIASWNVDGIRAWLKKGCLDYIKFEKPDILCLQEVKCPKDKLPEEIVNIPGYHAYWLCSDKDGYAGVGIYTTKLAISVKYGLDKEELDDEGRIITAEYEQFYLVSTYVPNAGRGLVTLPKRLEWNAAFLEYVKELDKKKPVIICGDMNVAHNEIDLANPKSNKKNAGFTPEERAGMTELLEAGFVDTYRHLYPDTTAAYTFWTYMMGARAKNVGWRLDYMIVSQRLLPAVCDSVIRNEVYGSDHCPITLFLHLSSAANPKD